MQKNDEPTATAESVKTSRVAAIVTIIFALLLFIPLGILGSAIEWPENLSKDAAHNLPLLLEQKPSVFWGYFIYLIYSILFFPMGHLMAGVVADGSDSPLVSIASGFAVMSATARSIGLCRWLFVMPTLARLYEDPNATDTAKEAISIVYEAVNGWGGGIGEILGVCMFAAAWVLCTSLLFLQTPKWPSWMGYAGIVVAIDLSLNLLEMSILDVDMGVNQILAVVLLHIWLFTAALLFLQLNCMKCCMPTISSALLPVVEQEEEGGNLVPVGADEEA